MSFSNFRTNVLVRVLVLIALCLILVWGWLNTTWLATPVLSLALIAACAIELIYYVERTTREFTIFLSFVAHHENRNAHRRERRSDPRWIRLE